MSLQVWLPLNGGYQNQGLCDAKPVATYSPTYADGKIGKCMNGGTTVVFNAFGCVKSTKFTLAMWVKSNATNTTNAVWWKIAQLKFSDGTLNTLYTASEGRYKLEYNPELNVYCTSTVWNHIVYVVNGTKISGYVNGNLYGSATCSNPERLLSQFNVGGNANVYINDVRLYDHCLSAREIKEISKGLILHYPLRDQYIETTTNIAPQPILNVSTYSPGWDTSKHLGAIDVSRWTDGYNSGVTNPTIGYHAYWKYIDDQLTLVFPDRNSEISQAHRWLGSSSDSVVGSIGPNTTYTISFDARADVPGMIVKCGYYYYNTSTKTKDFHDGLGSATVTTSWKRYSFTFTTKSTLDSTQGAPLYLYGHYGSIEGTSYVRNIQCELKNHSTGYTPTSRTDLTVYDCSGYSNNGTINASLVTDKDSARNTYCAKFTGSQCINAGRGAMVKDALTVNMWAYMDNWSTYTRMASCTEGGGWNFESSTSDPTTGLVQFALGTGASANTYKPAAGTTYWKNLSAGWHMFTGTYDGKNVKVYVDGVCEKTVAAYTSATPIFYYSSNSIFVGAEAGASATAPAGSYFNGKISDFRIYSTALSADDIKELYDTPISISNAGQVFAVEFEEG